MLTFSTCWEHLADGKLVIFLFFFQKKKRFEIKCQALFIMKQYFKLSSEILTWHAKLMKEGRATRKTIFKECKIWQACSDVVLKEGTVIFSLLDLQYTSISYRLYDDILIKLCHAE